MKLRQLPFLIILTASVGVAGAQEPDKPSAKLPKPPDGWQYLTAKDGTYHFLFPTETTRSGSREQTFRRSGLTGKAQINYCQLKDDSSLTLGATNLGGAALKDLKIGDVYNLILDGDKESGTDVSEPKDFPIGNLKGREYSFTKGPLSIRKVVLVVKGRVYELSAVSQDKAKTTNATADTFLKSLIVAAPEPASKEGSKETSGKEGGKEPSGEALPVTPAPTSWVQKPPANAAYHPTFTYTDGKEDSGGTVFVIKSPSGKKLAVTAAHVLEPKEWAAVRSTTLVSTTGKKVLDLPGKPAYVGRGFDQLPELRKGAVPIFNTSEDFAIWALPEAADVTVLELADHEPKVNEWVWIAGQQEGKPLLFYRSKVTQVYKGTMVLEQHDRFNPTGFSGGPVLTAESKVIGTMLAGDPKGNMRQGATVGNLRERIKDR